MYTALFIVIGIILIIVVVNLFSNKDEIKEIESDINKAQQPQLDTNDPLDVTEDSLQQEDIQENIQEDVQEKIQEDIPKEIQPVIPQDTPEKPPVEQPKSSVRWFMPGESVVVHGYTLNDGMIFVGSSLPRPNEQDIKITFTNERAKKLSFSSNDPCLIDPKYPVKHAEPWEGEDLMPYWPCYDNIPDYCRGAYLEWLATGRKEPQAYIGYVFLFFYGLEYRLVLQGTQGLVSETEQIAIVYEINRLLTIYGSNRSFKSYASDLLSFYWAYFSKDPQPPKYLLENSTIKYHYLSYRIGRIVDSGQPITPELAFTWIWYHPNFRLTATARRCYELFKKLFVIRCKKEFPDGIPLKPCLTKMPLVYAPGASSTFIGGININYVPAVSDLFKYDKPIQSFEPIAQIALEDLKPYDRFVNRNPQLKSSIEALSQLPLELFNIDPSAQKRREELSKIFGSDISYITTKELYDRIDLTLNEKISKREAINLAEMLEKFGFGLAPDVRYQNIKLNPDESVAIFPIEENIPFEPSNEYHLITTILRLGCMVAQIDDDNSPKEEAVLKRIINENTNLTDVEKQSLRGFLHWAFRTSQKFTGIKNSLETVSVEIKKAISRILITVAHADGVIDPSEVTQLKKLYKTLGLDPNDVASDLHELSTMAAQNLAQPLPSIETDENSALLDDQTQGFSLNEELIRIRLEETKQVKGVLTDIFEEEEEEPEVIENINENDDEEGPLSELTPPHRDLLMNLIKQDSWNQSEIEEFCKSLNIMKNGALEILNEWSFKHVNQPIIEEGDNEIIYIEIQLLEEILNDTTNHTA